MWRNILGKLIYFISGWVPRQSHKAVFGCYRDLFTDNSKYLFLHYSGAPRVRAIWISGDEYLVERLNQEGHEAYHRGSWRGRWHALTAGVYCYSSYVGDINQWLCRGAFLVNLWHGSPLKEIEFDISNGPLADRYRRTHPGMRAWRYHQLYLKPDLMLAPSFRVADCFRSAFRLPEHRVRIGGYPRTDFADSPEMAANPPLPAFCNGRRRILYAPSWRDGANGNPYLEALDWPRLSDWLVENDSVLLLRLHPNEREMARDLAKYPFIVDISHREDIYDLLPDLALVITDYSSLYIDGLLFDVPVLFYRFDHAWYASDCRKAYAYSRDLPAAGRVVGDFETLLAELQRGYCFDRNQNRTGRAAQRNQFWQPGLPRAFEVIDRQLGW
ncbi:CDP-glycerol glycerophosphotransferase family protein [Alloalcanivorax marinus]|uniref:CDP-glycerol glycerophosphotransferase family protein n=1 Tax=Alloalcanivorax marinus TaxID=1177169 RepID=UPI0019317142|nr:CDP-glycerol glycerophosphotransferase family protein [Alloalcanivorax marinus]MBL7251077.1 CDP-glycerol glycerophosphotransferase family protein [Alloalcanivorax marinus]